jgi:outer membrane protein assembly factor BamB
MRALAVSLSIFFLVAPLGARSAPDWSRFRGPNGSGISAATNVPIEFGPQKNLVWRLALPGGIPRQFSSTIGST